MRELQATNSKVNLITETGLTMTQNNPLPENQRKPTELPIEFFCR
jgi:hypothetical protein